MKNLFSFIKKWSDLTIYLPVALTLFIFNGLIIRGLDPTAAIVNVEFLSILNFNALVFGCVMSAAYFIYRLFFFDFFTKGWEEKVGFGKAGFIHLTLWLTTVIASYLILTHNL